MRQNGSGGLALYKSIRPLVAMACQASDWPWQCLPFSVWRSSVQLHFKVDWNPAVTRTIPAFHGAGMTDGKCSFSPLPDGCTDLCQFFHGLCVLCSTVTMQIGWAKKEQREPFVFPAKEHFNTHISTWSLLNKTNMCICVCTVCQVVRFSPTGSLIRNNN